MLSDFLIVGAGVIGLSIARELHRGGARNITVIDKGRAGAEASWAAAGMLAPNAETTADDAFFRLCTASNRMYAEFAAQLLNETGIDVGLEQRGTFVLNFAAGREQELIEKYNWQKSAGIDVQLLAAADVRAREPEVSQRLRMGLYYPHDGQVENRKLVLALRKYCGINGIKVKESVRASGVIFEGPRAIGVRSLDRNILGGAVIITAGAWSSLVLGSQLDVRPIRGQMIELNAGRRILDSVVYSSAGYVVSRADGRILVGATVEDVGFDKNVEVKAINELKQVAAEIAPALAELEVKEAWTGLRPFASGGLPVIGRLPSRENVFVATGHFRNGILLAPVTARSAADELLKSVRSELIAPFAPVGEISSAGAAVNC